MASEVVVAAVVAVAVFGGGFFVGSNYAGNKARAEQLQQLKVSLGELDRLNGELIKVREAHDATVSKLRSDFAAEKETAAVAFSRSLAAVRSGSVRLRLPVASCGAATATAAAASTSGTPSGASAELASETGAALLEIAEDGDRAVRELTRLQQWSEAAVEFCNGAQHHE